MSANRTFFKKWAYGVGSVELKGSFQANGSVTAVVLANQAPAGDRPSSVTRTDVGTYTLVIPMVFPEIAYVSANASTTRLGVVAKASTSTNTSTNETTMTIVLSQNSSTTDLANVSTERINWEIQAKNSTVSRGQ